MNSPFLMKTYRFKQRYTLESAPILWNVFYAVILKFSKSTYTLSITAACLTLFFEITCISHPGHLPTPWA